MRGIVIIGGGLPVCLIKAIIQATAHHGYYREPEPTTSNIILEIENYCKDMGGLSYKILDIFDDLEDWIMPKVKPLISQVFSRRPINNPIAGRCY